MSNQPKSIFEELELIFSDIVETASTGEAGTVQIIEAAKRGLFLTTMLTNGSIKLGPQYLQSLKRPASWHSLPADEKWQIDKELGILDWTGKLDE